MSQATISNRLGLRPIRESVREVLTRQIVSGDLAPGYQPTMQDLVSMLGASATPIREALVHLVSQGLVEALPNRGFRICELEAGEVEEVYPLIAVLECEAVATAPPMDQRIEVLREINDRFRRCHDRPLDSVQVDAEWHAALLYECTNATLRRYLDELRTRAWRYEVAYMSGGHRSQRSAELHDAVLDGLENGNLAAALGALRENWLAGPRYLIPWIESRITTRRLEPHEP